ncbi:MAG: YggT family protein [Desulfovibrio sp.]|nr:YggT family protein [Desulfovibrio sp.]
MSVFNNLLATLAGILSIVLNIYFWIVIISAVLSWVNPDPYNPIVRAIRGLTEPVFRRLRRTFPFLVVGGMDLTPIAVILLIYLLQGVVVQTLYDMAGRVPMLR